MKQFYCLDLRKNPVDKFLADESDFKQTAKELKKSIPELSNYDLKIFQTEQQAEKYLDKYLHASRHLSKAKDPRAKAALLYKKRYLVQSVLKEKLQTVRNSPRVIKMMSKLKIGDYFSLYDQTYFLTVQLTKVTPLDDHSVQYDFKLAK